MRSKLLGINGLGRIGKLHLWHQLTEDYFDGYVISLGRTAGESLEDLLDFILNDSTYGHLGRFIYGYGSQELEVKILDASKYLVQIGRATLEFLTEERNPKNIPWAKHDVALVVDCTGVFLDPQAHADKGRGSLKGHLEAGAKKVLVSAPFKLTKGMPEDSTMVVYGINHQDYDPKNHHIISAASCTTTALSHMMKPLLDHIDTQRILTASMSTIHAATNNQNLLDALPQEGAKDLRKSRSALNNIILTSTGAAKALEYILPEIKEIGFMADSVRIPTNTVSLVALNLTFRSQIKSCGEPQLTADFINTIYKDAALKSQKDFLIYSDKQNVSSDMRGFKASTVIEGVETATKTGFLPLANNEGKLPVTHAKIFGWYDNEFGSYVNSLSNIARHIHQNL